METHETRSIERKRPSCEWVFVSTKLSWISLALLVLAVAWVFRAPVARASSIPDGLVLSVSADPLDQSAEQRDRERARIEGEREAFEEERERQADLDEREEGHYEEGMDALDEQDWSEAIVQFEAAARMARSRADGALYWKAWALYKAGRRSEALETIGSLRSQYPSSRWMPDAKALEIEVRGSSGQAVSPEGVDDEELKLIAINSLMNTDPERAIPLLEKVLKGPYSPRLKDKALFVLTQSSSPKAMQILESIAKGQSNPDLQMKAIKYLGMMGGERTRQIMSDVYVSSNRVTVKKAILRSFMVSGDRARLLDAARNEKDAELRLEAVRQLGVMGASDELWNLYQNEKSIEVKEGIIRSFMIGGSAGRLTQIAESEQDVNLRLAAIRQLGVMGDKTGPTLIGIYKKTSSQDIKEAAIRGLFVQGNAKGLIELAEIEKNPEMKKEIVRRLSIMNSKEANDYLMKLLEN